MEDTDAPPRLTRLTFHGPLCEDRAARIIGRLTGGAHTLPPATVLDIGCGWGEFMLRVLEAVPAATGVGVDVNEEDLARFVRESAAGSARGPADLVLCLGASHALSDAHPPEHTTAALRELRRLVAPGGRVVLGEGFWQRPPTPGELAAMWPGTSAGEFHDLAGLVDLAVDAGFRPAWIESASRDEWEQFESGYQADVEEWLAAHPGHSLAKETRGQVDSHRSTWLRGYRDVLGLAYLTLVPVTA